MIAFPSVQTGNETLIPSSDSGTPAGPPKKKYNKTKEDEEFYATVYERKQREKELRMEKLQQIRAEKRQLAESTGPAFDIQKSFKYCPQNKQFERNSLLVRCIIYFQVEKRFSGGQESRDGQCLRYQDIHADFVPRKGRCLLLRPP